MAIQRLNEQNKLYGETGGGKWQMGGATRVGVSLGPSFERGEVSTTLPSVRKMLRHVMHANEYHRLLL